MVSQARAALWADFIPGQTRTRWEGLLPTAALQPGPVDPGCKEVYLRKTSVTFFHLLILYYLCHTFPVMEVLILLYFLVPFGNLMYCKVFYTCPDFATTWILKLSKLLK